MRKQKEKIEAVKPRELDLLKIIQDLERRISVLEMTKQIQYIPYQPYVPGPTYPPQTPQFPPINPGPYYYNSGGGAGPNIQPCTIKY